MSTEELEDLRRKIEGINAELLALLSERGRLVEKVRAVKSAAGLPAFAPDREQKMLDELVRANPGPFSDEVIRRLFKEIFKASLGLIEEQQRAQLRVIRGPGEADRVIDVGAARIGADPTVIAGSSVASRSARPA